MSLRVFVEIGGLDVRQQHGDPAGVPAGALWCSDAGCWLREFKDDEAVERAQTYIEEALDAMFVHDRELRHRQIGLMTIRADLLLAAAIGGET